MRLAIAAVAAVLAGLLVGRRAGDLLFGSPVAWLYLVVAGLGLVGVVWTWWLPWPLPWRALAFVAAVWAWTLLLGARGLAVDWALRGVFRGPGGSARMGDLDPIVQRIVCAAELHAGHHLYLLRDDAYNHDVGTGTCHDLHVSTAVQASANLPGAFPVRWLSTRPFRFQGGMQTPRWLAVSDGGVYDNMADQWHLGFAGRLSRVPTDVAARWRAGHADLLVVANASGPLQWRALKRSWLPFVGEVAGLLAVKDVLYDQTTSNRRRELIFRFDQDQLRGTLVHIATDPFTLPTALARHGGPSQRARAVNAQQALQTLGTSRAHWAAIAAANSRVGTQLWPLGTDVTTRLLHHAYVQTAVHLHVLHGFPLPEPMPGRERFARLVCPTPTA